MKTVILFDQIDEGLEFFVTENDVLKFDDFYINDAENGMEIEEEAIELIYTEDYDYALPKITKDEAVALIRQGSNMIIMGSIP